ncbi:cellulose synthase/poly-beta-1,6-N-acetylglucosamine synthase-like glycosyltransferase [Shimia isoporae]|uniref:Cellulose synthase/poly-beta-1,6-N-acetylglucosamine synthase-like glycosyltransferase n=1 Tax=Shimia isoporae TaxID=647720 RepID=A0A4R1N6E2_9RHOB|nr:glycosyltransferase [Shimia isoporae]TCL00327.1 cellulose synthase/poly-beta-1,6-N-acetylglucosamine synthase-like glycosyltransferase [Shimia isoporae]
MRKVDQSKASRNEFWSVDSQPEKLSGRVALWRAPAVLVTFVLICAGGLIALQNWEPLSRLFPSGDWVFVPVRDHHSVAIRHFLVSFFLAFGLFCNGTIEAKARLIVALLGYFFVFCATLDYAAYGISLVTGLPPDLNVQEIAGGLAGFAVFSTQVFRRGAMPDSVEMTIQPRRKRVVATRFFAVTLLAATLSYQVTQLDPQFITKLRSFSLLGGLGPGVFLFLPSLFLMLYLLSCWDRRRDTPDPQFRPPLSIVIPAHNEEYIIAHTVAAIEAAAIEYGGEVNVLVVNNNSSDSTRAVTEAAFAKTRHVNGRVIDEARPGKAHALNRGFAEVQTDFVIRIDADTQIHSDALWRALSHFSDPTLGCLGGVPFTRGRSFFERARQSEVLVNHGYYAIGTDAIEALVAIPGMFAVYRSEFPRLLGGFAFGLNGEDSDMSMRIGEMGYRVMVDPKVRYESEVPATLHHMREQRMRWFRSAFHIAARCAEASRINHRSLRGIVILPLMLLNTSFRAMSIGLIFFGMIEFMDPFSPEMRPQLSAIFAVAIGAPFLVSIMATLINRSWRALLYVPEYTLFRLFRSYYTLESLLSITVTPASRPDKKPVVLEPLERVETASSERGKDLAVAGS